MSIRTADRTVSALVDALGVDAVATEPEELAEFRDPYTYPGWAAPEPLAVVSPTSVEQVRRTVAIANEQRVPLWTFSQGRNNAYGGASARVPGSVLVSLRRMNRVLEIDEELAYALVEPGVSFFDLHQAVRAASERLWISVPVLGWGSVVGNTLEAGWGYTPHGDHAANFCGLEVVLADGEVVRTGMGALPAGERAWPAHKRGFGPSADGLFVQSNLGIVTKMGVWLMPRPEVYAHCRVTVPGRDDVGGLVEALRPLLQDRTIQSVPLVSLAPPRLRWTARFGLYGHRAVVEAQLAVVSETLAGLPGAELEAVSMSGEEAPGRAGDMLERVMAGIPSMDALAVVRLQGGEEGGQLDFSPVAPLTGADTLAICELVRSHVEAAGFPYSPGLILTPRSVIHTSHMPFDTRDEERVRTAFELYPRIAAAAARAGYGIYRSHVRFMDDVASQYDWGDGALGRFNERVKDALDPNGILSPGKQGIWGTAARARWGAEAGPAGRREGDPR
jgi:4-cresol dehydrogenase (hydroxylating)